MRLKPGTPHPQYPQSYTVEQYAALDALKAPKRSPAVASEEHVNAALAPDGTLLPNMGPKIIAAAHAQGTPERAAEIADHVNAERFLFIVDADLAPVVYFPCAVSESAPPKSPAKTPAKTTSTSRTRKQGRKR